MLALRARVLGREVGAVSPLVVRLQDSRKEPGMIEMKQVRMEPPILRWGERDTFFSFGTPARGRFFGLAQGENDNLKASSPRNLKTSPSDSKT